MLPACTASPGLQDERPSIVLIVTDDQRHDTLWAMPEVRQRLIRSGIRFRNAFVVNPLCCPSRASILTGQYSHTTGVYRNVGEHGGFDDFRDDSTIATWLQDAGYRTALIGKYLNGYADTDYIPPGWDRWAALERAPGYYYDYNLNLDGELIRYGASPNDYSTDVLADLAVSFIEETEGPLLLYFAPHAPHGPPEPVPRHETALSDLPPARPPSFNERNVSDKPIFVRSHPVMDAAAVGEIDEYRRGQFRSLLPVDEAIGRILDALQETGRLQNTLVVFTSDNGEFWGEHRLDGKQAPYEEAIRVPFVVRYDALVERPHEDGRFVLNVDLAPTFAELARIAAPGAEGRSLLPLVQGARPQWRADFLLEHLATEDVLVPPDYCAVRTKRYLYVVYGTGERELYDLTQDPSELVNRAADPALQPAREVLHRRMRELCQPPPPGFALPDS
ncbi:MAG: sulfatase family protein [Actinomycetota bacterium]